MAQTPGGKVLKLALVRSFIDLSKIYFCQSSPTEPLYVGTFSHFSLQHLNMDASTRPLLCMLPNRADVSRGGSNGPRSHAYC